MRRALPLAVAALLAASVAHSAAATSSSGQRLHSKFRPLATVQLQAEAQAGKAKVTPSKVQCRVGPSGAANVLLDCDSLLPNNEPHIAVDPQDPRHMVASSNDYDQCCDAFYTTFDGGRTWFNGNMSVEAPVTKPRTGSDPVTTFNAKYGTVIHSSLNFLIVHGEGCDSDVVASVSDDGGRTWNTVVTVADGGGPAQCETNGLFNDKEWITTDNTVGSPYYGRTYLTWTAFRSNEDETVESPIWEAHSDDGGHTWSTPHEISGSNPALCTFQTGGPRGQCDEDQFSVPSVGPDGTVYVSFINDQNRALWERGEVFDDQYMLVESSDGGRTWSKPTMIAALEDGSRDFPINVSGRQTLTGVQFRAPFTGNVVADPTKAGRLYFTFFDNRNGVHDVASPRTDTDVFLMVRSAAGAAWKGPIRVSKGSGVGNDQWFPWVDVDPTTGRVGIVYQDRGYDPSRATYRTTLSEGGPGGTGLEAAAVSTRPSHPRRSRFFQADAKGCRRCATFIGDYISIAYGSNGRANLVWTDMRDFYSPAGAYLQFIYYARR